MKSFGYNDFEIEITKRIPHEKILDKYSGLRSHCAWRLIQAVSLRIFFVPANLASGGVSGIAQLINHFTGWPIGLMVLIGNIPLFVLGWRFLGGRRFAMRTAFAIVTYSLFTDLLLKIPAFPLIARKYFDQ